MEDFAVLRACPLFDGVADEDLPAMLRCLGAQNARYQKGETIFTEGAPARTFGIVLAGHIRIERVDYYGNRTILTDIDPAELFGESFACAGIAAMPVDVVAVTQAKVLLIDARHILQPGAEACAFHSRMTANLLQIVANKNLQFHQKIEITSRRTTREKLMAYLLMQAKRNGGSFTIPFDRQGLADYLEVERSGLCTEIGKLRKEQVLTCTKNRFSLCRPNEADR